MHAEIHLVYSSHRPETIGLTTHLMEDSDLIILEEPPHPDFTKMLCASIPIDDFLLEQDIEYPEFSFQQYSLLQQLSSAGKTILQVEPFLQHLLEIHMFFAAGHSPQELDRGSLLYQIYSAEHNATARLIHFYQSSTRDEFDQIVIAVNEFAQADAERLRLRDTLRAEKILSVLANMKKKTFIEAGPIHFYLEQLLCRNHRETANLTITNVDQKALRKLGTSGNLFSPGDELTLYHQMQNSNQSSQTKLLAARALIYNKIVCKEEITESTSLYPHVQNEYESIRFANTLSYKDCEKVFSAIRFLSTQRSLEYVEQFSKTRS